MSAVVSSYTFHSATQSPAGDALETLPTFRGFERAYLQPLLQRPPSAALWLDPLLEPACALVAWLVNPSPLRSQPPILLGPDRRPGRALTAYAGPHVAAVWWPALEQARALLQARATATGKQNKKARLAAVAFPAAAQGGCCLHVAVHAVRLVPGGRRPAPCDAASRRTDPRRAAPRCADPPRPDPPHPAAVLFPRSIPVGTGVREPPSPPPAQVAPACCCFTSCRFGSRARARRRQQRTAGRLHRQRIAGRCNCPRRRSRRRADSPLTAARCFPGARAPLSVVCAGHSDRAA